MWKDGKRAKEAAGVMKITAQELKSLGIIEQIIPEYGGADKEALSSIGNYMKGNIKLLINSRIMNHFIVPTNSFLFMGII